MQHADLFTLDALAGFLSAPESGTMDQQLGYSISCRYHKARAPKALR